MRPFIAILLIVCGTALASAPAISDYLQSRHVEQFLAERPAPTQSTFFRQPLGEEFILGSWILGGSMIGLGIIGGRRPSPEAGTSELQHADLLTRAAG